MIDMNLQTKRKSPARSESSCGQASAVVTGASRCNSLTVKKRWKTAKRKKT